MPAGSAITERNPDAESCSRDGLAGILWFVSRLAVVDLNAGTRMTVAFRS
jgi:hypothetical protein